jgi:hypothetical protein
VNDVETGPTPQRNDVALNVRGDVAHRHDGAKAHEAVGPRVAVVKQLRANARANAIGADEHPALMFLFSSWHDAFGRALNVASLRAKNLAAIRGQADMSRGVASAPLNRLRKFVSGRPRRPAGAP